jgi:solute carrier family 25 protein 34/35
VHSANKAAKAKTKMYATLKQFGLPAVAGSTAVLASHPLELVKSRLQLDNELRARGAKSQYNGWLDCVKTSWARGGARDLWRGVQFGVAREFVFNAARIGSFDFFKLLLADYPPLFAGFCSGALGGCVANPVEVLKVRACVGINQCVGCAPSSRRRVDGVQVDATNAP